MSFWICAATRYPDDATGVAMFGHRITHYRPEVCYNISSDRWPLIAEMIAESRVIYPVDARSGLWSNDGRHIGPPQCQLLGMAIELQTRRFASREADALERYGPLRPGSNCMVRSRLSVRELLRIARHITYCGMEWDGIVIV